MRAAQLIAILGLFVMTVWGDPPAWWLQRGVIQQNVEADDYGLLNQGQLKQFALGAFLDWESRLPDGAGWSVQALLDQWTQLDETGHRVPLISETTQDYAPVNLGQLKAVAQVFYDRMIELGSKSAYPWTGVGVDDFALANAGQAKALFAFDLWAVDAASDTKGNGIPDWWQMRYLGHLMSDPNQDSDGDGVSDRDEYLRGTDPLDYFNGKEPVLTVVSGDQQKGLPGAFLSKPFVVQVTDGNGVPLKNAPVTFQIWSSAGGGLATGPDTGSGVPELSLRTDENGMVSVYLKQTGQDGVFSSIGVIANGKNASVDFSAKVDSLPAPVILSASTTSGVKLTWSRISNVSAYHLLRSTESGSGYQEFPGNTVTGVTSLVDNSVDPGGTYYYIVQAVRTSEQYGYQDGDYGAEMGVFVPPVEHSKVPIIVKYLNWKGASAGYFPGSESQIQDVVDLAGPGLSNGEGHSWSTPEEYTITQPNSKVPQAGESKTADGSEERHEGSFSVSSYLSGDMASAALSFKDYSNLPWIGGVVAKAIGFYTSSKLTDVYYPETVLGVGGGFVKFYGGDPSSGYYEHGQVSIELEDGLDPEFRDEILSRYMVVVTETWAHALYTDSWVVSAEPLSDAITRQFDLLNYPPSDYPEVKRTQVMTIVPVDMSIISPKGWTVSKANEKNGAVLVTSTAGQTDPTPDVLKIEVDEFLGDQFWFKLSLNNNKVRLYEDAALTKEVLVAGANGNGGNWYRSDAQPYFYVKALSESFSPKDIHLGLIVGYAKNRYIPGAVFRPDGSLLSGELEMLAPTGFDITAVSQVDIKFKTYPYSDAGPDKTHERNLPHPTEYDAYYAERFRKCVCKIWETGRTVNLIDYLENADDVSKRTQYEQSLRWRVNGVIQSSPVVNYGGEPSSSTCTAIFVEALSKSDDTPLDCLIVTVVPLLTKSNFDSWYSGSKADMDWLKDLPALYSALGSANSNPEPPHNGRPQWHAPEIKQVFYHPGASYEMRSYMRLHGYLIENLNYGHQACYDEFGVLISSGVSGGSADREIPFPSGGTVLGHLNKDVKPYIWGAQLDGNPVQGNWINTNMTRPMLYEGGFLDKYLEVRPAIANAKPQLSPGIAPTP